MGCSPPGSSVHEILQARILEWVAVPFSRGSSWPRDRTHISCIAGRIFTIWATREAYNEVYFGGKQLIEIIYLWFKFRICSEVSNTFVSHVICFGKDWGYRSLIKKINTKNFLDPVMLLMKVQTCPLTSPEMQQMNPAEEDWLHIWLSTFSSVSRIPLFHSLIQIQCDAAWTIQVLESAKVRFYFWL